MSYRILPRRRPDLRYPCLWRYKLIGDSSADMHAVVTELTGDRDYRLTHSRTSSHGRYRSFDLERRVLSDDERTRLYRRLCRHPSIAVVL